METRFIVIEINNMEQTIGSAIKNDFEQQLDCDYFDVYKKERDGDAPMRYEVTVTVKKLGLL